MWTVQFSRSGDLLIVKQSKYYFYLRLLFGNAEIIGVIPEQSKFGTILLTFQTATSNKNDC